MPADEPDGLKMAVFMPIRRPALSNSGPPELPGLIAASVWITFLIGRCVTDWISRPVALTMPFVSVWSRPNGLPMANADWPTCKSADRPIGIGVSLPAGAPMYSTATSLSG